jgi:DNA-binding CsgD family transcriptional regulator
MSEEQIELLSEREKELVRLVSKGLSNRGIARELHISPNTVKVHLRNIYGKLKVSSRTEATMVAVRMGWVEVPGLRGEQASVEERAAVEAAAPEEEAKLTPEMAPLLEGEHPPESLPEPPLALWQRIYLVVSALLVALGLWLIWPSEAEDSGPFPELPPQPGNWIASRASRWQSMAQMPTPRRRLAVTTYRGQIYAIAGTMRSGVGGAVEIYTPETDEWRRGADKPIPVESVGAVELGGKIYVPGGRMGGGEMSDQLEIYEPRASTSGRWTRGERLPKGVCAYALGAYGGDLYLFGGWDGRAYVSESYRYSPQEDRWYPLPPLPTPRAFAGAGTLGGRIYVVGGYSGEDELATCEVYDPGRGAWGTCPSMNAPRGGLGVVIVGDTLYAIGGGWTSFLVENEFYSPDEGVWKTFPSPVLQEWRDLGIAVNETSLYAIGGWDGDLLGTNQAYRAIYRLYLPNAMGQRGRSSE